VGLHGWERPRRRLRLMRRLIEGTQEGQVRVRAGGFPSRKEGMIGRTSRLVREAGRARAQGSGRDRQAGMVRALALALRVAVEDGAGGVH
jgi:hypothetical protein